MAELAGVERSHIALTVEPRRMSLRGRRGPPELRDDEGPTHTRAEILAALAIPNVDN